MAVVTEKLTVEELVELALEKAQIPEAASWVSALRSSGPAQADLFRTPISQESVTNLCYGISLRAQQALALDTGLEDKGHSFLEEIRLLAAEHGVVVSPKKADMITTLKHVFSPI